MKPARILFVSYYRHPRTLTATRNYYLSRLLADAGHEVHVLTRDTNPADTDNNIQFHRIQAWDYRKILIKLGVRDGVTSTLIKPGAWIKWGFKFLMKYPFNKWLGEGGGAYYLKATREGMRIIDQFQISHIYSSYRPITDHLIAEQLKIKYPNLVWIGDFRDVLWWNKNDKNYQASWIKKMILRMDHLTAVTSGIGSFWSEVFHKPFITLYNGLPLKKEDLNITVSQENKFVINYTGSIYTEFQQADILFRLLKDLNTENKEFANDLLIRYSGIHDEFWRAWMKKFELLDHSIIEPQVPIDQAWTYQSRASINLLLTWTTPDITGFIHGKFNEYLAMQRPILCVVEGNTDTELDLIYRPITNSLIAYNRDSNKEVMKGFILHHYHNWKRNGRVEEISQTILDEYKWSVKGKPLLDLINSSK